jgi:hypothetical protein
MIKILKMSVAALALMAVMPLSTESYIGTELKAEEAKIDWITNVSEAYAFPVGRQVYTEIATLLYEEQDFRRHTVFFLPSARGLLMLNRGQLDSDLIRPYNIGGKYPNIVRVPTPLFSTRIGYFCLTSEKCKFLEAPVYIIPKGFDVGNDWCLSENERCLKVNNDLSAFKALENGTGDRLIADFYSASGILCGIKQQFVFYQPLPELDQPLYHYVAYKNRDLVPELDSRIKILVEEDLIRPIQDRMWENLDTCGVTPILMGDPFSESFIKQSLEF